MKKDLLSCQSVSKVDSKGRISIPAEIRKTLGLNENDVLDVVFSITEKIVVLKKNDCGSATASTAGCGPVNPSSILGRGPEEEGDYG